MNSILFSESLLEKQSPVWIANGDDNNNGAVRAILLFE